jgi:peptide/nickel transport system substrate-binding protein
VKFRLLSVRTACLAGAVALVLSTAAACSSGSGSASSTSTSAGATSSSSSSAVATGAPKAGGSLTVLEGKGFSGDWPLGLDPATNTTGSADQDYYNAVFGQLFELGANGKQIFDLATRYQFSKGNKTITIDLRPNVKFSDGSALTASVVAWNWTRDLESSCTCAPMWTVARTNPKVTTSPPAAGVIKVLGPLTIQVNLAVADGAFINTMYDTIPNWIISEQSFKSMGETAFAKLPVGAGPFIMTSDSFSNEITMKKNPSYWDQPLPYLDSLTFKSVSGDEAAYEAMLAGEGQVYIDMSTPQLLSESAQHFNVINQLGTSPYDLQLNTSVPPFNNPKAREAIYAMTDFAPILQHIFDNAYPTAEGFTGPGGICYQQNVRGYQGYNPTLAKQLVAASGLNKSVIQFGTISSSPVAAETVQALSQEWAAFGVKTSQHSYNLNALIGAFLANGGKSWQAMIQTAGAYDPAGGVGVGFRFNSTSPFSGVHDPKLDTMLAAAAASSSLSTRCPIYNQAAEYIAKNYYGPFYFSFAPANVAVKGVVGPGLTSALPAVAVAPAVLWEDVYDNPAAS